MAAMTYREVNFDGLIGPTHNYSGLALGNLAAAKNAGDASNPKAGALQGIAKMRALAGLGLTQGFLPPHDRPHLRTLRALGFTGADEHIIEQAASRAPELLANASSASPMWTANAATIAPSVDTADNRVHITPANLAGNFHRSIEADTTARLLAAIFPEGAAFAHHAPLPGGVHFGDEGAANHNRLAAAHDHPGVHLFVYGEDGQRFPARQKRRASQAVARNHQLAPARALFLQQSTAALDAGAFHNDVVCVANGPVLFLHEQTFEDRDAAHAAIRAAAPFVDIIEAKTADVPLPDAITSYLFNSQLVSLNDGEMALILPTETEANPRTRAFVDAQLAANNPINRALYLDVRESMRNGGGPACLRLRVLLSDEELAAVSPGFILDDAGFSRLEAWAERHYRDRLAPDDLRDPSLMRESFAALDDLTGMLSLGSIYDFQRDA
jgi:succinylarginine dihydrolase